MFQNSIQVAGVRSLEEARLLEDLKVSFVGFPLKLGYHKPDIDHDTARAIIREMRDPTRAVLITYLDTAEDSVALCRFLGVSIVQLHAVEDSGGWKSPLLVARFVEEAARAFGATNP